MEGIFHSCFEIKLPLNSLIFTQIPCRADTPAAKTCHFFAISSKEVRGREGLLAAQSAVGIVWGPMSYAMHNKPVQETCSCRFLGMAKAEGSAGI